MVRLNYVNDEAYALARAASLRRRGLGGRRADQLFRAAGIADEDSAEARREMREGALAGALRFAERRKIGPYALEKADLRQREKAFAAMIRAGHDLDVTRRVLAMGPDDIPLCDSDQYS
jgi:regulatory protein